MEQADVNTSILAAVGSGGIVGFMLGLLGGGGSILATPLLLYVVGVAQPHIAIGTGALAVSVNAFANFASHADDLTGELTHALRLDPRAGRSYKTDHGNTPLIGRALRP
ncbi:TSUP family transporter [Rhizobium leguminosarum]|uniref:TSUP family transporter n=1 Tax=Rhizobium leguminosarum TaxID=384 RepID=UPI002484C84A|nr:TSUP family transporter [Rhizobium leguminosarum]